MRFFRVKGGVRSTRRGAEFGRAIEGVREAATPGEEAQIELVARADRGLAEVSAS